jgi:predicted ribosome quality control (RQC) complex YloA/Tae2 family protein
MKHLKKFNESKKDRPNYKKLEIDGFIVYQGKDAIANDYVTLELSDDNDIWFHAKGVPGSHLLIKVKERLPQQDVIKKIAELAAKNSKATNGEVTIVYCKKKFVKKEQGMNAGQVKVDYTNAYEIKVPKK